MTWAKNLSLSAHNSTLFLYNINIINPEKLSAQYSILQTPKVKTPYTKIKVCTQTVLPFIYVDLVLMMTDILTLLIGIWIAAGRWTWPTAAGITATTTAVRLRLSSTGLRHVLQMFSQAITVTKWIWRRIENGFECLYDE